ncbi:MAG: DUF1232 domain-containing protein [Anaerolineales bacterium]|nr:DUF1232 domain-containing protein [Anaerolineales bacterium]
MKTKTHEITWPQPGGFLQDIILQFKLILRLMGDRRVNFFLKLLPVAALVYLVSPLDFFPGLVLPFIGALDDAAIIWIGVSMFTALCPEDVVQEHMNALQKVIPGAWRDAPEETDIVEVTPRDVPEDTHPE